MENDNKNGEVLELKMYHGNKKIAREKAKIIRKQFEKELNTSKEEITQEVVAENESTYAPAGDNITNTKEVTTSVPAKVDISTDDIGNMLYGDYLLKVWLPFAGNSIDITSYSGYQSKVKITAKYFNNLGITLNNLTRKDIKTFYTKLQEERKIKNKTVNRYHANIHKSLEDAISEFEVLDVNVAHGLRRKEEDFIPSYYKLKELETLFEKATGTLIELHVLLAAYYGFRREEFCRFKMVCNRL